MGVIERFGSTLYCTALMIDPVAGLAEIHRKLMPTGTERLIWGFGDGSTIGTAQSRAGRVGTVICWENYMPALRQAMYAQGVEIYCAPTADDRPTWISTMTHIALEGRVFVLTACQAIRANAYPDWYQSGKALARIAWQAVRTNTLPSSAMCVIVAIHVGRSSAVGAQ